MTFHSLDRPLVLITGFKSGTWLIRKIIDMLIDSHWYEPTFIESPDKYSDPKNLTIQKDGYYCWHLNPTPEIRQKLKELDAKVVILLRNVFEVSVSILHHFYYDIDAEIGRSAGKMEFLQQFDLKDAQTLIITGFNCDNYYWEGLSEIISHYLNCIEFQQTSPDRVFTIDFKSLVTQKAQSVERLAQFLNVQLTQEKLLHIIQETDFNTMKAKSGDLRHYRKGISGDAKQELNLLHIKLIESIINSMVKDEYKNYLDLFRLSD